MVNTQKTYPLDVVVENTASEKITSIDATFVEGSPLTSEQIDLTIEISKNTYDESGYTVNTPTIALVSSSGMSVDEVDITPAVGDYNYNLSFVVKKTTLDATFGQLVITCSQGSSAHDKVNYLIDITAPVTTEKIEYITEDLQSVETINTNQSYTDLRNDIKTRATSVKPSDFYVKCDDKVPDEYACLTELHVKVELQRTIFPQFYDEDDTEKFLFKHPVEETVGPVLLSKFNPLVITDDVGMNVLIYTLVDGNDEPATVRKIVKTLMIKPKITVEETGSEGLLEYYSGSMANATYPYDIYVTVNKKNSEEIMDPIVTTEFFKDKITVDFTDQTLTEDASDSSEKAYIMSDKMSDGQVVSTEQPYVTVISNKYGDLGLDMTTKVFKMTFDNVSRIAELYITEAGWYHDDHELKETLKNEADTALETANADYELAVSELETAKTTKEENERAFDNATHAVNDAQLKVDALTQDKATLQSNLDDVQNQVNSNNAKLAVDHTEWKNSADLVSPELTKIYTTYGDENSGIVKDINDAKGVVDSMKLVMDGVDVNNFSTFSTEIKEYLTKLEEHLTTANERDTELTDAITYTTSLTQDTGSDTLDLVRTDLKTLQNGDNTITDDNNPAGKSLSELNIAHSAAQDAITSFMDDDNDELKTAITDAETNLSTNKSDLATKQNTLTDKQTELSNAQSGVAAAEAEVAAAQATKNAADDAKNAAIATKNAADDAEATAQGELDAADTALTAAQAAVTTAQSELGDAKTALGDETSGAVKAFNDAQSALEAAQTNVNAVTAARVTVLEKEAAVAEAQAAKDAAQDAFDNNSTAENQIALDNANSALTAAQSELTDAQAALAAAEATEPTTAELQTLETTRNDKQAALATAQAAVAEKEAVVAQKEAAVTTAQAAKDAAQAAKDAASDAVTAATGAQTAAVNAASNAQDDLSSAQDDLSAAQAALTTAQTALTTAQDEVDAAQAAVDAAQDAVTTAQANYDAHIQELRNAVEDAQKQVNNRNNNINAKQIELSEALELQSKHQDYLTESGIEDALQDIKTAAQGVDIGTSLTAVTSLKATFDSAADAQSDALQALLTNFVQSLADESSRLDTLSANTTALAGNFAALKSANDNFNTEMSEWLEARKDALQTENDNLAALLTSTKNAYHAVAGATAAEATDGVEVPGSLLEAEVALAAAEVALADAQAALAAAEVALAAAEVALAEKEAALGNDGTNGNPKTGAHAALADAQQAYEEAYSTYSKLHRLIKNTTGLDTNENPLYVSFMSDVISTPDYDRYLVNHKYSSTVSDLKLQHNGSDSNNNILDISFTSSNANPEEFVIDVTTDDGIENLIMKEFESSVTPQFIDTDSLALPSVTREGFVITLDSNLPASYLLTMSVAQETELIRDLTLEKLIDREETFIVNVGYELNADDGKLSCVLKTVGADTPGQKNSTDVKVNDCGEYEFVDENKLLNDLFEHLQYSDTVIKTHTKSQMGGLIEHFVKIKNVTISDGDNSVPLYNEDVYANAKTFNTVELSTFELDNPDKLSVTLYHISQGNTKELKDTEFEFTIGGQSWTGSDESHIRLKYVDAPEGNTFKGVHKNVSLIKGDYFKYNKEYCAKPGELLYSAPSIPNVTYTEEKWLASTGQTTADGSPINNCYSSFNDITFINNYGCEITLPKATGIDQVSQENEWNFIPADGITYSVTRTIPSIVPGTELRGHSVDEDLTEDKTGLTPDPNKTITTTYEVRYTDKQGFSHTVPAEEMSYTLILQSIPDHTLSMEPIKNVLEEKAEIEGKSDFTFNSDRIVLPYDKTIDEFMNTVRLAYASHAHKDKDTISLVGPFPNKDIESVTGVSNSGNNCNGTITITVEATDVINRRLTASKTINYEREILKQKPTFSGNDSIHTVEAEQLNTSCTSRSITSECIKDLLETEGVKVSYLVLNEKWESVTDTSFEVSDIYVTYLQAGCNGYEISRLSEFDSNNNFDRISLITGSISKIIQDECHHDFVLSKTNAFTIFVNDDTNYEFKAIDGKPVVIDGNNVTVTNSAELELNQLVRVCSSRYALNDDFNYKVNSGYMWNNLETSENSIRTIVAPTPLSFELSSEEDSDSHITLDTDGDLSSLHCRITNTKVSTEDPTEYEGELVVTFTETGCTMEEIVLTLVDESWAQQSIPSETGTWSQEVDEENGTTTVKLTLQSTVDNTTRYCGEIVFDNSTRKIKSVSLLNSDIDINKFAYIETEVRPNIVPPAGVTPDVAAKYEKGVEHTTLYVTNDPNEVLDAAGLTIGNQDTTEPLPSDKNLHNYLLTTSVNNTVQLDQLSDDLAQLPVAKVSGLVHVEFESTIANEDTCNASGDSVEIESTSNSEGNINMKFTGHDIIHDGAITVNLGIVDYGLYDKVLTSVFGNRVSLNGYVESRAITLLNGPVVVPELDFAASGWINADGVAVDKVNGNNLVTSEWTGRTENVEVYITKVNKVHNAYHQIELYNSGLSKLHNIRYNYYNHKDEEITQDLQKLSGTLETFGIKVADGESITVEYIAVGTSGCGDFISEPKAVLITNDDATPEDVVPEE